MHKKITLDMKCTEMYFSIKSNVLALNVGE